jgi:hypothetical protein
MLFSQKINFYVNVLSTKEVSQFVHVFLLLYCVVHQGVTKIIDCLKIHSHLIFPSKTP